MLHNTGSGWVDKGPTYHEAIKMCECGNELSKQDYYLSFKFTLRKAVCAQCLRNGSAGIENKMTEVRKYP